jgi:23S rRNA (guanosine2251-2'-O)-methyltransferase
MVPAGFGDRVEGRHAVTAALAAGRVEELWVEKARLRRPELADLAESASERGIEVRIVDDLRRLADTDVPQGVVARCRPRPFSTLEELAADTPAAIVAADHIGDPQNLGAIARSALAAGMTGLMIPTKRAAPLSAVAFKAAAGALESIPVALVGSVAEALGRLGRLGVWAVGLAADGEQALFDLALLTEPVALVVGGEGTGISRLARERCEVVARIPLSSSIESLNAAAAATLACFEVMRVRAAAAARSL